MAAASRASSSRTAEGWTLALVALTGLALTPFQAKARDCSEATQPTSGAVVGLSDPLLEVALDGDRAYALCWTEAASGLGTTLGSTLLIYDFASTNPAVPLGSMFLGWGPLAFAVQDGLAYLASNRYLSVVDLSNPANIHELGYIDLLTEGREGCVAVGGGRAYVGGTAGLHVVDVTDPAAPSELGSVALSGKAISVALGGSFVYVGTLDARMAVVDVSDPAAPRVIATILLPDTPWDIEIRGSHAYVADGLSGLQVLDISRPSRPEIAGSVGTGDAHGVSVSGARAYVVDWGASGHPEQSGLRVTDISNPARPVTVNLILAEHVDGDIHDFPIARKLISAVSASESRVAFGGTVRLAVDCAGSCDNSDGFLKVGRASTYESRVPRASRTAERGSASARLSSPGASPAAGFGLTRGGPNPFNPETSIRFEVARASRVRIRVYDARGQLVRTLVDATLPPGRHEVAWRGRNEEEEAVGSGIYIVAMEAEGFRQTRKITLLK